MRAFRILLTLLTVLGATVAHSATCWPEPGKVTLSLQGWSAENYKWADIPASAGTSKPQIGWYKDACTGKWAARIFTEAEAWDVFKQWSHGKFLGSASVNTWIATQPKQINTVEDTAYLTATLAALNAWKVAAASAGTRPLYTLNATSSALGKKIGAVAVGTPCDTSKRLGTTNYYFVPSLLGYAICAP